MSGPMRSADVGDGYLASLDRGSVWLLMWKMRYSGSPSSSVRAVCRRWERLTGKSYYGDGER